MSNITLERRQITATIRHRPANDVAPRRNPFAPPQPLADTLTSLLMGIVMLVFIVGVALGLMVFA